MARLGLFDARVPRYTSYPPATAFGPETGAAFQAESLAALDPSEPVSVYVHIPFCERLCYFCACRTQGTSTLRPVAAYLDTLLTEIRMLRDRLPQGVRMGQLHSGGGTPTILTPDMIARLASAIKEAIPPAPDFAFSVEIDPTLVDAAKIVALAAAGMTRASIGVQDFDAQVQQAIGRQQSFEQTRDCIETLREAGITSLNTDLVYGLPHQTEATFARTLDLVAQINPDRIALFGYAHVPTFSKRQRVIPQSALPDDRARYHLAQQAAQRFATDGYHAIGIDHFARPGDSLTQAALSGRLRRNFQGYTDDRCPTLLGIGASSISQFAGGYVQNAAATAAYTQRIAAGQLPGFRGYRMTADDRLRARAINMLMCDFAIDLDSLAKVDGAETLHPIHAQVLHDFAGYVALQDGRLQITPQGRPLTRLIAQRYDGFADIVAQYSQAS